MTQLCGYCQCAYVDRVVHYQKCVIHVWPTIKGWTAEALKQREDAERDQFGTGKLEDQIDKDKYLQEDELRRLEGLNRGEGGAASRYRAKRIRDQFIASSAHMDQEISKWVDDFKRIPVELLDDECLRVGSQIEKKLLGVEDDTVVDDDEIVTTLTQVREDEEEYNPEWIEEMEKMMEAYDKNKTITIV